MTRSGAFVRRIRSQLTFAGATAVHGVKQPPTKEPEMCKELAEEYDQFTKKVDGLLEDIKAVFEDGTQYTRFESGRIEVAMSSLKTARDAKYSALLRQHFHASQ